MVKQSVILFNIVDMKLFRYFKLLVRMKVYMYDPSLLQGHRDWRVTRKKFSSNRTPGLNDCNTTNSVEETN